VDTRGEDETVHNPCFTCHTQGRAPNYIDDSDLQLEYSFPAPARNNHWTNLWMDRASALESITDREISGYVSRDNYRSAEGIAVAEKLRTDLPPEWDVNGNGEWDGYVPDVFYNPDPEGFDRDMDGNYTGWKQYHYAPFPGNFSPINGSVGDAFIRLGEDLRQNVSGDFDLVVYRLNLAIVEAAIRYRSVTIDPIDEKTFSVDLDRNGRLSETDTVAFSAEPGAMKLVGMAGRLQAIDKVHLEAGLFPEFTEFFHTLRYLQVNPEGGVTLAPRMKEVRHAIKKRWYFPAQLSGFANDEAKEKAYTPDRPRWVRGNQEYGVSNALAWQYHGFIEDAQGKLRPQTHEELVFCVGCHSGIGATTDSNFSFARKLGDGHGNYFLHGGSVFPGSAAEYDTDPGVNDLLDEFAAYFEHNGAANDFRSRDVSFKPPLDIPQLRTLLWPSAEGALLLNKAYRLIVLEQSYTNGRDAIIDHLQFMHREVEEGAETGVEAPFLPGL